MSIYWETDLCFTDYDPSTYRCGKPVLLTETGQIGVICEVNEEGEDGQAKFVRDISQVNEEGEDGQAKFVRDISFLALSSSTRVQ